MTLTAPGRSRPTFLLVAATLLGVTVLSWSRLIRHAPRQEPGHVAVYAYPPGSVRCAKGDYVIEKEPAGGYRAFLVKDVVGLTRLVPFGDGQVLEEGIVLDSLKPAYAQEIYLLLEPFDERWPTLVGALGEIGDGKLQSTKDVVCRPIDSLPEGTCTILKTGAK